MRGPGRIPIALAAAAAAALTLACRSDVRPDSQAGLPPLPELSSMAEPVQRQIRAQYEKLEASQTSPDHERARQFGTTGELLMAAESAPAAEPFLDRAAALDPASPRWPYFLGHLHRMKGDSEGAVAYFDRARALRPDDVPSLVWLANLYLDQGQADKAVPLYERALQQQPGLFAARFGLGRAAMVSGAYSEAVTQFEAALAIDPQATAVNYPLAMAYRQVGRLDDAETRLRMRGTVQPPIPDPLMRELAEILESPVVYEGRGDRALGRGDFASAVDAFRRAVALAPDRMALKQKLATALALTGNVREAVEIYEELLKQNPDFAEAHYSLGALFLGSGRIDLAIERFAMAVRADPTYLQARLQLAHALRRSRAFDRALEAYQGALSVDPRLAEARLGYSITLADAGRFATARAWLNEGRRAHPDRPEFVEVLVRVLSAAPDESVRDGHLAVELGERLVQQARSWRTLEALAMALAESGRWDEAIARQREAIDAHRQGDGDTSRALIDNMRRYESRLPCRVPWAVDPI